MGNYTSFVLYLLNCYTPPISSRTPLCFDISCLRQVSYQRSCQTHNTNEAASSHSIVTSPPLTALHSTTHPTICLPHPSILHAGRHLRSCCLTLVSNCSCPRVLHAGAKTTATSLAATVWPTSSRVIADDRTVAHAVSLLWPGCYPRRALTSRFTQPSASLTCVQRSLRYTEPC